MRFFNTAGPVNREDHYCIDPLKRVDLEEILFLIGQKNILSCMRRVRPEKPRVSWR